MTESRWSVCSRKPAAPISFAFIWLHSAIQLWATRYTERLARYAILRQRSARSRVRRSMQSHCSSVIRPLVPRSRSPRPTLRILPRFSLFLPQGKEPKMFHLRLTAQKRLSMVKCDLTKIEIFSPVVSPPLIERFLPADYHGSVMRLLLVEPQVP